MRIRENVTVTETDFGAVLLDQLTGEYWQLNTTATLVLNTLLGGSTEEEAVDAVLAEYDTDREQATRDVHALLEHLRLSGLVTA